MVGAVLSARLGISGGCCKIPITLIDEVPSVIASYRQLTDTIFLERPMPTRLTSLVVQLVFVAIVLGSCPSTLLAAKDASGSFSPHCDGASFFLSKVDGLPSEQNLILNMRHYALSWWSYRPQEVWEDVYAERCSAGKCQNATHARIWLSKGNPSDRRVSGKYEVDFGGQHFLGTFFAKYRKEKASYICE